MNFEQGRIWDEIRAADWSATSLGPLETWPVSLRTILRTVISTKQPACLWWGPELLQFHNEAYLPMLGDRAEGSTGRPFRTLWPDVWDDIQPFISAALGGEAMTAEDLPLVMTRFGFAEATNWSFCYSPLYDDDGDVAGILNITADTTALVRWRRAQADRNDALESALGAANDEIEEQREAAKVRAVVQRELSHRLKNAYTMVQAIVAQTMRHATSNAEAAETIVSRIQALAAAQDILTRSNGEAANIQEIVAAALLPHQEKIERIEVVGPAMLINAHQGMGLALAVHELATNAAKYGGLSLDAGLARASWGEDGGAFRFDWAESGGPAVSAPSRRGFGSRLLERVIPSYFGGSGKVDYDAGGVRYALSGKLSAGRNVSAEAP